MTVTVKLDLSIVTALYNIYPRLYDREIHVLDILFLYFEWKLYPLVDQSFLLIVKNLIEL